MTAPLAGIRVVEIASFVAAPAGGALLADLGAEVVKVEVPQGEIYRFSTPRVSGFKSDFPEAARFRQIHDGHCTFLQPEERIFVTPEAIENTCVVGSPEEIITRVQSLADAGIDEVVFLPPADYQRKVFRDLAESVIPAFR